MIDLTPLLKRIEGMYTYHDEKEANKVFFDIVDEFSSKYGKPRKGHDSMVRNILYWSDDVVTFKIIITTKNIRKIFSAREW